MRPVAVSSLHPTTSRQAPLFLPGGITVADRGRPLPIGTIRALGRAGIDTLTEAARGDRLWAHLFRCAHAPVPLKSLREGTRTDSDLYGLDERAAVYGGTVLDPAALDGARVASAGTGLLWRRRAIADSGIDAFEALEKALDAEDIPDAAALDAIAGPAHSDDPHAGPPASSLAELSLRELILGFRFRPAEAESSLDDLATQLIEAATAPGLFDHAEDGLASAVNVTAALLGYLHAAREQFRTDTVAHVVAALASGIIRNGPRWVADPALDPHSTYYVEVHAVRSAALASSLGSLRGLGETAQRDLATAAIGARLGIAFLPESSTRADRAISELPVTEQVRIERQVVSALDIAAAAAMPTRARDLMAALHLLGDPIAGENEALEPMVSALVSSVLFDSLLAVRKSVRGFGALRAAALVPLLVPERLSQAVRDDAALLALVSGACPAGASVWLSTGEAAVVIAENPADPMRPVVLASAAPDAAGVPAAEHTEPRVIDLARMESVTVQPAFSVTEHVAEDATAVEAVAIEAEAIDILPEPDEPTAA